jgi:predicted flap endonuclease-1-like 5' DNA nuclease
MPALVRIEGIGETYADKLANARIGTTQTLLKRGATRQGRKEIAKIAGVDGRKILNWVNRADLFRIHGVGEEYSDLLEAAGVDTVVELAQRNPDHLVEKMVEVNERRNLVRKTPALSIVTEWIHQAKKLPRVVEY